MKIKRPLGELSIVPIFKTYEYNEKEPRKNSKLTKIRLFPRHTFSCSLVEVCLELIEFYKNIFVLMQLLTFEGKN